MQNFFKALHFELTHQCNLCCKHCYNIKYLDSKTPDLTINEVKRVIDIARNVGCQDFGFSGGEPFCREDFVEVLEYTPGPIHILTNALLIKEEHLKKIDKMNKVVEFRVSFDGLESHKLIRNVDYQKVVEKIKMLLRHDHVVTVNTMLTPYNAYELWEMYTLLRRLKIDRWRIDFIFNSGNALSNNLAKNNEESFRAVKALIERYITERPAFEFDVNKFFRSVFLEGAIRTQYSSNTKVCSYQGALTVRPGGEVSFCPSLGVTYGNILKDPIQKIIANENWKKFKDIRIKDIEKCLECKLLAICGGGCRADAYYSTGSYYKPDECTCHAMEFYYKEIRPIIEKKIGSK